MQGGLWGQSLKHMDGQLHDTVDAHVSLGWQEIYDSLPTLQWTVMDAAEFAVAKQRFHDPLIRSTERMAGTDTSFVLLTAKAALTFHRPWPDHLMQYNDDKTWTQYIGFIPRLQIYLLQNWWNGEFTLGSTALIDCKTNVQYDLISHTDGGMDGVIASSNHRFLMTFASGDLDEAYAFIGIIQVRQDKGSFHYAEYASATLSGLHIVEAIWMGDAAIALQVNARAYNEKKQTWEDHFSYLSAVLPAPTVTSPR